MTNEVLKSTNRHLDLANGFLRLKGMYCIIGSHVLSIIESGWCKGAVCPMAMPYKYNIFTTVPHLDRHLYMLCNVLLKIVVVELMIIFLNF